MPKAKGPGLIIVFVPCDSMTRIDLRTIAKVIEPQDVITRDNVSVRVNAVLYFRVVDPMGPCSRWRISCLPPRKSR